MNTKIGTTFGLALLVAIAAIATMLAMGMFSAKEARAGHDPADSPHVLAMTPSSLSVNAKASWTITLGVSGAALTAGAGTIAITFPTGVVVPATIDKSRISAGGDTAGNATYIMHPLTSDPTVSGQTVTLTVPATNAAGGGVTNAIVDGSQVKVFFSQLAGLLNPAKSDAAGTTAAGTAGKINTTADPVNGNIPAALSFNRTLSNSATTQTEGGAVTVTVGGFTPGLTVTLSSGTTGGGVSGSGVVGDDRKAAIAGTMKSLAGTVIATDTAGLSKTGANITVKAELSSTATGKAGDTITLIGKNFNSGGYMIANGYGEIDFGGVALTATQDVTDLDAQKAHTDRDNETPTALLDDFLIKIRIPSGAKAGVNQIKVTDAHATETSKSALATVTVTGRSVTIEPDSGPPGTVVTINGTGFPASRTTLATHTTTISPVFGSSTVTGLFTNGSGALPGTDQFTIPASATTTVITLTVTIIGPDGVASTGSDKFTVTARALTVVPAEGPRGTKVLVTGTKFTASDDIAANSITAGGVATVHAVSNITSSGDVPGISFPIPGTTPLGSQTISATDTVVIGTTKFNVLVPTLAVGLDSAYMGQSVPITGAGWVPASSVTITLASASVDVATKVATADADGGLDTSIIVPSTVGVGPLTVTFTAADATTYNNTAVAQTMKITKPTITLSVSEASIGDVVTVTAAGFPPSSGMSILTIGGADVRAGAVITSDTEGGATTSFIVPGVTGSNIVTVKIGANEVSTSMTVLVATTAAAAATTAPADIFADVIANDDSLVRVWRFANADQSWQFYDPRPAFASANTLEKSGTGDIVWVNVTVEQTFQSTTLYPGWNLISLD